MSAVNTHIELLNSETLAVRFPYDAQAVAAIKRLQNRRWNPRKTQWEIHLSELAAVMKIFALKPQDLDPVVIETYRRGWIRTKLKVRLGPLEGRLSGTGAPLPEIDAATSYYLGGFKFSEKFQSGQWDGKRHLFSVRTQKFPAGLWPRVRAILEAHQVEFELEDETAGLAPGGTLLPAQPPRAVLRDYQQAAIADGLALRRGIIQIATGGGKTLLAASLLRQIGRPAFFFVHTRDLLYQSAAVFRRELGIEPGLLGDGQANLRVLTVATIQTALQALGEPLPKKPKKAAAEDDEETAEAEERFVDLDEATRQQVRQAFESTEVVIFDECHHVPADGFYKIAMHTRAAGWRFGLSATPWRDDGSDLLLEAALGPRISQTSSSDLIERGYLVAPHIRMVRAPRSPRDLRGQRYQDIYQLAIVENQERNRVIAAHARGWAAQGLSILILVAQVTHGRALQELLPEANFAYGALESELRQQYLRELEQKLRPIMIATTLADEGLDIPSLNAVILGGGGKSQTKAFQRIGRALRPAPGKVEAQVLDFLDQAPYLKDHSEARLALYGQEPRFVVENDGSTLF